MKYTEFSCVKKNPLIKINSITTTNKACTASNGRAEVEKQNEVELLLDFFAHYRRNRKGIGPKYIWSLYPISLHFRAREGVFNENDEV
jgi:hypothetical protein